MHSGDVYQCSRVGCDKEYKSKADLTRHEKSHDSTDVQCPDCDYHYKDRRNYESHSMKYNRIYNYWCETCHKAFGYRMQLKRHIDDHNSDKGTGSSEF